ncbi:MAG: phosphate butyryltransferase [Candidatus Cloacimonas sp. 4484_209]|nr:MAG: phosphate butyryltransferase [Candidatus Cloacimonas sp. 4484_209]
MSIKTLDEMLETVKTSENRRVVVACGNDPHTIEAAARAVKENIVDITLVGNKKLIQEITEEKNIEINLFDIVDEQDEWKAGKKAVLMVRQKRADILMKGLISTADYMKLVLDKDEGLLQQGKILSHIAVLESPNYPKLLFIADVAVIPSPTLNQKVQILNYCIEIAHRFGIDKPKAAIIAATEKVSLKMQATTDAAIITQMARRGQIKGAIVDGPLALDVAISKESCEVKGLNSPIGGEADILIFPNIETGNVFYKSITKLGEGRLAALVTGAAAPCILTSRADSEDSKFLSIALAAKIVKE